MGIRHLIKFYWQCGSFAKTSVAFCSLCKLENYYQWFHLLWSRNLLYTTWNSSCAWNKRTYSKKVHTYDKILIKVDHCVTKFAPGWTEYKKKKSKNSPFQCNRFRPYQTVAITVLVVSLLCNISSTLMQTNITFYYSFSGFEHFSFQLDPPF